MFLHLWLADVTFWTEVQYLDNMFFKRTLETILTYLHSVVFALSRRKTKKVHALRDEILNFSIWCFKTQCYTNIIQHLHFYRATQDAAMLAP